MTKSLFVFELSLKQYFLLRQFQDLRTDGGTSAVVESVGEEEFAQLWGISTCRKNPLKENVFFNPSEKSSGESATDNFVCLIQL